MNASHAEVQPVDDSPFDFVPEPGVANGAAALCLHGLTGTPYEVRPLAEALAARGIRARGIWMAGHGGSVEDLARSTRSDWVERARAELAGLRAGYERVFLVGLSMGGLVSLRLAQTERVEGLVVVGVPLALAPRSHSYYHWFDSSFRLAANAARISRIPWLGLAIPGCRRCPSLRSGS